MEPPLRSIDILKPPQLKQKGIVLRVFLNRSSNEGGGTTGLFNHKHNAYQCRPSLFKQLVFHFSDQLCQAPTLPFTLNP